MGRERTAIWRPDGARHVTLDKAVIFDADDTLWVTQWLFDQAREEARRWVEQTGIRGAEWEALMQRHNHANVAQYGFSPHREPAASVAAYVELAEAAGQPINPVVITHILAAFERVFTRPLPPVAGAYDTLRTLRKDHLLALITKGDPDVQRKRIADSGLAQYFDIIAIVPEKGPSIFRRVIKELGVRAGNTWTVGNSLPSDVIPGVLLGMRGVWIDAHVWGYERNRNQQASIPPGVTKLGSLRQLVAHITRAERAVSQRTLPTEGLA